MKLPKRNEKGFTLIELMIVIAIIGILAAIAIPQFNAYRARSYNASANSDLRNAITAQEGYFIDHDAYSGSIPDLTAGYGLVPSSGVAWSRLSGTSTGYTVANWNNLADQLAVTFTVGGPGQTAITRILPP